MSCTGIRGHFLLFHALARQLRRKGFSGRDEIGCRASCWPADPSKSNSQLASRLDWHNCQLPTAASLAKRTNANSLMVEPLVGWRSFVFSSDSAAITFSLCLRARSLSHTTRALESVGRTKALEQATGGTTNELWRRQRNALAHFKRAKRVVKTSRVT